MGANTIPPNTHNNNTNSIHPNNNSSSDIIDKKLKDGKIERMWTQKHRKAIPNNKTNMPVRRGNNKETTIHTKRY